MNIAHEVIVRYANSQHTDFFSGFKSRRAAKAAAAKILKAMDSGSSVCIEMDRGDDEKSTSYLFDTRSIVILSVRSYKS